MEINKNNITKWSSKKESYYTYHDDNLGEVKIILIEHFDDKNKLTGVTECRILKDNYCLPDLVKEVFEKHYKVNLHKKKDE